LGPPPTVTAMDFSPSARAAEFTKAVRSFIRDELAPVKHELQRFGTRGGTGLTDVDDAPIAEAIIADRYHADADAVRIYRLPAPRVIKASFPRPVVQGGFTGHDMRSGQHHLPLAKLLVTTGGTR
jgi:hypothetical protein